MGGSSETSRLFKKAGQQGRSERRAEDVHAALRVGRLPFTGVLANGKAPQVNPTSRATIFGTLRV